MSEYSSASTDKQPLMQCQSEISQYRVFVTQFRNSGMDVLDRRSQNCNCGGKRVNIKKDDAKILNYHQFLVFLKLFIYFFKSDKNIAVKICDFSEETDSIGKCKKKSVTTLNGKEICKLLPLQINTASDNVRPGHLKCEVGHIQLHKVQSLKKPILKTAL